jgi:hypothetical protein
MKKISLSIAAILLKVISLFSQESDSSYVNRKLNVEEINIVSSYYHQDGNNSAVTGGIGTEKLSDYANSIELKLYKYNHKNQKNTIGFDLGIDHFTSASSDNVSPNTGTNASSSGVDSKDTRIYPTLNWQIENEKKGTTYGVGTSLSHEFDYLSFGTNFLFSKKFRDNNSEISNKVQIYLDRLKLVYPAELIPVVIDDDDDDDDRISTTTAASSGGEDDKSKFPTKSRKTISNSLSYSHIINRNIQIAIISDLVFQKGYLGLPFHRVYFDDSSLAVEKLPNTRIKIPIAVRGSFFIGDKFIIRSYYRFYYDTWNLKSNTINIETPIKITPFISLSPFYRFYQQSNINYFAPYKSHLASDKYYTSNYDLSKFNSHFMGIDLKIAPPGGILGLPHVNMIEIRYGYYKRNIGLKAQIISINMKFK